MTGKAGNYLQMHEPGGGVVGEGDARRVGVRDHVSAIQSIVGERRGLVLPVGGAREVVVVVVLEGLGPVKGIDAAVQPVSVVVLVRDRVPLGIRHGAEVPVRIVGEGGEPLQGIHEADQAIQVVVEEPAHPTQRVGLVNQPGDSIIGPVGNVPEGIGDGREIARIGIGEGRLIPKGIRRGEHLPGTVIRHERLQPLFLRPEMLLRIGDGGEVAVGIILESGRAA